MGGGRNHFTPYDKAGNPKGRARRARPDGRIRGARLHGRGRPRRHAGRAGRRASSSASTAPTATSTTSSTRRPEQPTPGRDDAQGDRPAGAGSGRLLPDGRRRQDRPRAARHRTRRTRWSRRWRSTTRSQAAVDKMRAIDPGLKNTLIVVTADHDHTMTFNGYREARQPDPRHRAQLSRRPAGARRRRQDLHDAGVRQRAEPQGRARRCDERSRRWPTITSRRPACASSAETHGGGDVKLFATGAGLGRRSRGRWRTRKVFHLMKAAFGF